jgi:tetratricopeptide (TPR) repeat protein
MEFINNFQRCLLNGSVDSNRPIDLFSNATLSALKSTTPGPTPHLFTQIFEPGVLQECAILANADYDTVRGLDNLDSGPLCAVRVLYENRMDLTSVEAISTASSLVAVSRFDMATTILDDSKRLFGDNRLLFEADWLRFLITNRCHDGKESGRYLCSMRAQVEKGMIPVSRQLDLCTQVVVWYLKRNEVDKSTFGWALEHGDRVLQTKNDMIDIGTESSWYRGVAMVPAKDGDAAETRRLMQRAHNLAERGVGCNETDYGALNNLKTYWESTLKEHMFVTRDREAALAAASSLIDLDPAWSPSYAERADMLRHFGDIAGALNSYRKAVAIGPPYYGYHLKQVADCSEELGDLRTALEIHRKLADLAPHDRAIAKATDRLVALGVK